jgi:hypothetical protein
MRRKNFPENHIQYPYQLIFNANNLVRTKKSEKKKKKKRRRRRGNCSNIAHSPASVTGLRRFINMKDPDCPRIQQKTALRITPTLYRKTFKIYPPKFIPL